MEQICPKCYVSNTSKASFCANCGTQLNPRPITSQTLKIGMILNNRYQIVSLLGKGGFGAVYRAYDMSLKRSCAVKENLVTGQQSQEQFQQEASVLANLTHPNLPRVTDYFYLSGQGQYLVMDYVDGNDLDSVLSQGKTMPVSQALNVITQIADALTYLHTRPTPIIHRDIKPANIRLTTEGSAFLVDFGLVKLFATQVQTAKAARAITNGFSPPEQYGRGGTDARSDIYALGATMYALLTGSVPQESVSRRAQDTLPQTNQLNPMVSPAVSQVITQAMSLDPAHRYQSADAFVKSLKRAQTSPTSGSTHVIHQTQPVVSPDDVPPVPVSRPLLSGVAIGALITGVILILTVAIAGIIILPKLLATPTSEAVGLIVTTPPRDEVQLTFTASPIVKDASPIPPNTGAEERSTLEPTDTLLPTSTATKIATPTTLPIIPMDPDQGLIAMRTNRSEYMEIGLINADGSNFRHLTSRKSFCDEPDFSPDGQRITFECKTGQVYDWEIYITRIDGREEYSLGEGRQPAWSPDGSWITFEKKDTAGNEQIWRMDSNGERREQLTRDDHPNRAPSWSPDGRMLVMMAEIRDNWQIVILDLNTMQQKQITSGNVDKRFPVWSPDGQWIAFNSLDGGNPDQIWIIEPDGRNPTELTHSGQNGRPTWSPDSQYLMYNGLVNNSWSIVRISIDGSGFKVISPGEQPDWAP